jgi:type IV pilus assembly protein PilE
LASASLEIQESIMSQRGFTLIELMVAVAIVAILAMIAYPSYLEHLAKGRRADAQTVLMQGAQYLERIYTERGSYKKASSGAAATSLADVGFPNELTGSPVGATNSYYTISISNWTDSAFTLTATRTGIQSNDKCGDLTLTNSGVKDITNASGATATECWRR